ncbi:MAG: hypothetical protein IPL55_09670 [Saprospiraceae bacterium]|nr:hypothetical protein [Saprospiraceae bacterium]
MNLNGDKRDYIRGFDYQGAASREGWQRDVAEIEHRKGTLRKLIHLDPGHRRRRLWEILPYHDNRIMLDKRYYDAAGNVVTDPSKGKQKTGK